MERWIEQLTIVAGRYAFMCPSCLELTELDEHQLETLAGLALRCTSCTASAIVPDTRDEYDDTACLRYLPSGSR